MSIDDERPRAAANIADEARRYLDAVEVFASLDADRVAAEVDRLDERRADAAHRVEHELARLAVAADDRARELRQHLARMRSRLGQVAGAPLHPRWLL